MAPGQIKPPETIEQTTERMRLLDGLMSHPGWGLFEQYTMAMEESAFQHMIEANNAHDMARHAGVLKGLKSMRTWPMREVRACQQALGINSGNLTPP